MYVYANTMIYFETEQRNNVTFLLNAPRGIAFNTNNYIMKTILK